MRRRDVVVGVPTLIADRVLAYVVDLRQDSHRTLSGVGASASSVAKPDLLERLLETVGIGFEVDDSSVWIAAIASTAAPRFGAWHVQRRWPPDRLPRLLSLRDMLGEGPHCSREHRQAQ